MAPGSNPFEITFDITDGSAGTGAYIGMDNIQQIQNMINSYLDDKKTIMSMKGYLILFVYVAILPSLPSFLPSFL